MSEYYKRNPGLWMTGTDDLTLEQEAAYSRIIDATHLYDHPVRHNLRVLGGLWRCNERKAKRLLADLIAAGKLRIEGDFIINERAMNELSIRNALRVERRSAGYRGGIESGKARAKPLKDKETDEAHASTRREENRIEEKEPPLRPPKGGEAEVEKEFDEWWPHYPRKVAKGAARRAFVKARRKAELDVLVAGAKRYAASVAGKEPEFIAHPPSWLNAERWSDFDQTGPPPVDPERQAQARVRNAKDWLSRRSDMIPSWMDDRETAERLVKEGYDYEQLRKAGFSLPIRDGIDIREAVAAIAVGKRFGGH